MSESDKQHTPKTLVERREFLGGAASLAGASLIGRANGPGLLGVPAAAEAAPEPTPAPIMSPDVEHRTKRWQEQRWLLDAVIQLIGPDWDEGRLNGQVVDLCGPDVLGDVAGIRGRVRKFNDLTREFARAAVRREKMARQSEASGNNIAAREDYFMAAILYMYALWPIFEKTRELLALNERKNTCYAKYVQYADHEIRRVEIPLGNTGKSMPGYLHLPPNRSGRVPCVWDVIGVGGTRERSIRSTATSCASEASRRWAWMGRDTGRALSGKSTLHLRSGWTPAKRCCPGCVLSRKSILTASP